MKSYLRADGQTWKEKLLPKNTVGSERCVCGHEGRAGDSSGSEQRAGGAAGETEGPWTWGQVVVCFSEGDSQWGGAGPGGQFLLFKPEARGFAVAERIIWEAGATPKEKHPAGPRAAAAIVPLFSPWSSLKVLKRLELKITRECFYPGSVTLSVQTASSARGAGSPGPAPTRQRCQDTELGFVVNGERASGAENLRGRTPLSTGSSTSCWDRCALTIN